MALTDDFQSEISLKTVSLFLLRTFSSRRMKKRKFCSLHFSSSISTVVKNHFLHAFSFECKRLHIFKWYVLKLCKFVVSCPIFLFGKIKSRLRLQNPKNQSGVRFYSLFFLHLVFLCILQHLRAMFWQMLNQQKFDFNQKKKEFLCCFSFIRLFVISFFHSTVSRAFPGRVWDYTRAREEKKNVVV